MSWVEKVQSNIVITCGDGREYSPLYVITEKTVEYNVSEFDFVGIEGTLVKRFKPRGRRYTFELTFQGDDHLDQSEAFENSAKDPRPWNVFHPYYGNLLLQPTGLTFDPSSYGLSKITGELIETISEDFPRITVDPIDNAPRLVDDYKQQSENNYVTNVDATVSDAEQLRNNVNDAYNLASEKISDVNIANEYFQLFNRTLAAINNYASDASSLANFTISLLTAPALFREQVSARIRLLIDQYEALTIGVEELLTPNEKIIYEMNAGAVVSAMALASVTPIDGDYDNTNDVLEIIESVVNTYDDFIDNLNDLQTLNGGNIDSYVPNFESASSLSFVINYTISNLMDVALEARKERRYILDHDSNPILLAHRFYGLTEETSVDNINRIINHNNLSFSELFIVEKGKEIIYYV